MKKEIIIIVAVILVIAGGVKQEKGKEYKIYPIKWTR